MLGRLATAACGFVSLALGVLLALTLPAIIDSPLIAAKPLALGVVAFMAVCCFMSAPILFGMAVNRESGR